MPLTYGGRPWPSQLTDEQRAERWRQMSANLKRASEMMGVSAHEAAVALARFGEAMQ
jgi:hypothetical protein